MPKIIAITGLCGAGKTVAASIITTYHYQYLRFGQIVIDILQEKKLRICEENEKRIRQQLRDEFGMGAFAIQNQDKMDHLLRQGNIVIDGLYSFDEYKIMKEKYKNQFFTLAIYAPPIIRYQRLEKRVHDQADKAVAFRPLTYTEAVERDYHEIEKAAKGGPIAIADHTIINTGTLQNFEMKIKEFLNGEI